MTDALAEAAFRPAGAADYGAFYTPAATCRFMVHQLEVGPQDRVLEPSAGEGAFIAALLDAGVRPEQITAWELDPSACATLRARFPGVRVERRDTLLETDRGRERFDRIIANPPYLSKQSAYVRAHREQLAARFGAHCGSGETFTMFLWLALDLLAPDGRLVAIVGDSVRTLATHERLRRRILQENRLELLAAAPADLFAGAAVRTTILSVSRARPAARVRVLAEARDEEAYARGTWTVLQASALAAIDGHPFVLEAPPSVVALFAQPGRLGDWADGHIGMHTRDNARHLAALEGTTLAARFERTRTRPGTLRVISAAEAEGPHWAPYLKEGGDKDFWHPLSEYVDWRPEARAGYVIPRGGLFGKPGLCVSGVSGRLSARVMPPGCRWDTNKVMGLVPRDPAQTDFLLGLLNSDLYTYVAKALLNGSSSIQLSDLWKLPVARIDDGRIAAAAAGCLEAYRNGRDAGPARAALNAAVFELAGIAGDDRRAVAAFLARRGLVSYDAASG